MQHKAPDNNKVQFWIQYPGNLMVDGLTQLVWPDIVAMRAAWTTSYLQQINEHVASMWKPYSYILIDPSSEPVRSLWLSGLKARDRIGMAWPYIQGKANYLLEIYSEQTIHHECHCTESKTVKK